MTRALRGLMFAGVVTAAMLLSACNSGASPVVGTWGDPEASNTPSLTFEHDGNYAGTDGCNRVAGSWKADGDSIDLGLMVSTRMACEGVDTWLSSSTSARIDGSELTLLDESGNMIGSLKLAEK